VNQADNLRHHPERVFASDFRGHGKIVRIDPQQLKPKSIFQTYGMPEEYPDTTPAFAVILRGFYPFEGQLPP
jgi:hypothetical protein